MVMKNVPLQFFEELGPHYVYGYWCNDTDTWKYIGKGVGNRVLAHVAEKGYDPEDAHILVQNLPDDKSAALAESMLIDIYNPRDNKVSGHHTERFIMASLKGLFDDYVDGQRNFHMEKADFLLKHRDTIQNTIGGTASTGSSFSIWSSFRESTQFLIIVGKNVQCQLKVQPPGTTEANKKAFANIRDRVLPALEDEYELEVVEKGIGGTITWTVEDEETAIQLWSDFVS
jgi:hypothetical protein